MNWDVPPSQKDKREYAYVVQPQKLQPTPRLLNWWYRLTAPPEVAPDASLAQRERVRRGQLSSTILLVMLLFTLTSLGAALLEGNRSLLFIMLPSLAVSIIVLILNRLGKGLTAGIILVAGFEVGYIVSLLRTPGGLGASVLPRFDLLVEAVLLAVSFLPARIIPWIALGNCLFIWADLTFMPHTPDLGNLLRISSFTVIEDPIALQIIVASVTYLWVRSTNQAIARADRAEVIATLQQTIAEQKKQLDVGIQHILHTHVQIANGNFQARAPLAQDNALWQIAVSLNNLLSRLQRFGETEQELRQTRYELQRTREALQQSRQEIARLTEFVQPTRDTQQNNVKPLAGEHFFHNDERRHETSHNSSMEEAAQSLTEAARQQRPFQTWRRNDLERRNK
jgi:hypothetical protein